MKKITFLLLLIFVPIKVLALADNATSAVIIETTTGSVLFDKEMNQELAPASMTKIMTLLLTMESIENGNLKYDEEIVISENASGMGGSQVFLDAFSKVKVEELIKSVAIASANDAAVALAERIGGTTEKFVNMMNEKAQDLNLEHTHFVNVHGLDADGHYSSAYDMAVMARELIKYEKILNYTGTYEDYFTKPDGTSIWLVNTNKLVRFYDGVDGLKTGYTENAKYCLTSTAKKNNIRFITVVMGEPSSEVRSKDTSELLNYAFSSYKLDTILEDGYDLGNYKVSKGLKDSVNVITKGDITDLVSVEEDKKEYNYNINVNDIVAPIYKGDIVGNIEVLDEQNNVITEGLLTVNEDILKTNYFHEIKETIKDLIRGKKIFD